MDGWLLIRQAEGLPPGVIFAAGVVSAALVLYVVVACRRLLARRRAARTPEYPVRDPRRLRADAERLREACDVSAAGLEAAIAQLKERALGRLRELELARGEMRDLKRALAEKSDIVAELMRANAELELGNEKQRLDLRRREDELRIRAEGLAAAQQTISLLRDMLDRSERVRVPAPGRAIR
jgi:hypothetical protein